MALPTAANFGNGLQQVLAQFDAHLLSLPAHDPAGRASYRDVFLCAFSLAIYDGMTVPNAITYAKNTLSAYAS